VEDPCVNNAVLPEPAHVASLPDAVVFELSQGLRSFDKLRAGFGSTNSALLGRYYLDSSLEFGTGIPVCEGVLGLAAPRWTDEASVATWSQVLPHCSRFAYEGVTFLARHESYI